VCSSDLPAFVESRIRDRLGYVKKGETPYSVIDPELKDSK
jgi:cell division protein FtsB